MKNTCNSCLHWRQNPEFSLQFTGICVRFLESDGKRLITTPEFFCSRYVEVEPPPCTCESCVSEKNKVCGTCEHFKLGSYGLYCDDPLSGWVPLTLGCWRWRVKDKEPTDAASVLMSLLIKQMTELQTKVQDLGLKIDTHVIDKDRHTVLGLMDRLREAEKSNSRVWEIVKDLYRRKP